MTTASGVLSYTIPLPSARTEPKQAAAPHAIGSFSVYTEQVHPSTGNKIEGWHWDERVWSGDGYENEVMELPNNWDPTTSGVTESYFQSGIGSGQDLELEDIEFIPSSGLNRASLFLPWFPKINHGYYYTYDQEHYLYSDDSIIQSISYSGVNTHSTETISGFNTLELVGIPKVGVPISVCQYEWNAVSGGYEVVQSLTKKTEFTGLRDEDLARQSTYDAQTDEILWDLIDNTNPEFIVTLSGEVPQLICNGQYVEPVGSGVVPTSLEFLGYADGSDGQQFHLRYSPVDRTQPVAVCSYFVDVGPFTFWEPVAQDITPSGYQVKVDYDLGIVEFGDSTVSGQNIPAAGAKVGASYWKSYRVEYETQNTVDTVLATETNVNQIYRTNSRGFVYLSTTEEDPASISLAVNLPTISTDVFGPLYIGNSFAPVVATVKDRNGNVLEGQTVEFFVTSDPVVGGFGSLDSVSASTNELGQAKAYYNPPRGISDIGENVVASGWRTESSPTDAFLPSGLADVTILHTEKLLIEGDTDEMFVYEVHVDDPLQGYLDVTRDQDDAIVQLQKYYDDFFAEHSIWGSTGMTQSGVVTSTTQSGVSTTRAQEWEDAHRTIWGLPRPRLFYTNAGLGRKKLVATTSDDFLDPYTFTEGAVGPMQPIAVRNTGVGEYDVYFDTSTYALPIPTGTDTVPYGTFHSYFVVAPTSVKIQASVYNARLNQTITSNEISIRLRIPPYLSGLWVLDEINDSEIEEISSLLSAIVTSGEDTKKVPLGFRLRSNRVTLAGALDGVTFLGLNHPYNYDVYDNNEDSDEGIIFSGIHLGMTQAGVYLSHQFRVSP